VANPPPKAYRNEDFLGSRDARELRILSEYLEPEARFERQRIRDTIVFFGSARLKYRETAERMRAEASTDQEIKRAEQALEGSRYYEAARELSSRLTKWAAEVKGEGRNFVICTGAGPGIMEAANRGAHEAGGPSVGLGISLPMESQNDYVSPDLAFQFHYFFMRKLWFAYLAKAFIVFPGGFGTLDELMEVLTLQQTAKIRKPIHTLVYGSKFWKNVVSFDTLEELGTIDPEDRKLFNFVDTVDEAFDNVTSWLEETSL